MEALYRACQFDLTALLLIRLLLTLLCSDPKPVVPVCKVCGLRSEHAVNVYNDRTGYGLLRSSDRRYGRRAWVEPWIRFVAAFVRRPVVPVFIAMPYRSASDRPCLKLQCNGNVSVARIQL